MIRPGRQYEDPTYYWEEPDVTTEWLGKAAARAGFVPGSPVDPEAFAALREGRLLDGTSLHGSGGRPCQRGARLLGDFTAAAPKSVSLVVLALGDDDLRAVHDEATRAALTELEKHIQAWASGGRTLVRTGEAAFALFRHDSSRANEPHLHTHAALCNFTWRPDGVWRAVEQRALWDAQRLASAIYRHVLVQGARKLGYEIEFGSGGEPEIAGITREQIETVSSRRKEIVEAAAGGGLLPAFSRLRARQLGAAAARTQPPKSLPLRRERYAAWRQIARDMGLPTIAELRRRGRRTASTVPEPAVAWEAVEAALSHLAERNETFRLVDLKAEAITRARGQASPSAVAAEIARRAAFTPDNPAAIYVAGGWVTTPEAVQSRERILRVWMSGRGRVEPISRHVLDGDGWGLTDEQFGAVRMILTSRDEMVGVVGRAGVGKTHLVTVATQLLNQAGWRVLGFAPTGPAARELKEIDLDGGTTQGLAVHGPPQAGMTKGEVWVFDEAGLMDARLFEKSVARARKAGARVLLLGDPAQHGPVAAGRPYAYLLENGLQARKLEQIQRQRDPKLRAVVEAAAEGRAQEAISRLTALGGVISMRGADERIDEAVGRYLDASRRGTVLVCTGTNAERMKINERIRELRIQAGEVAATGVSVECLSPRDLTDADRADGRKYRRGDSVVFRRGSEKFASGERGVVLGSSARRVSLRMNDGRLTDFNPKDLHELSVFEPIRREVSPGDRVEFREAFRDRGVDNGTVGTVLSIGAASMLVQLDRPGKGKKASFLTLGLGFPIALDYGYASTTYRAQSRTVDRVILSTAARYINPELAYVALSRGRHEATLITDDSAAAIEVLERVQRERAARPNPLEVKRRWVVTRAVTEPEIRLDDQPRDAEPEDVDLDDARGDGKGMAALFEKGTDLERSR